MNDAQKQELLSYYDDHSKHSHYQNYPSFVGEALGTKSGIDENWRGDTARYHYMEAHIPFDRFVSVGDIGANTGRFCLDLAHSHPSIRFTAIERNPNNIRFISLVKESFSMCNIETLCGTAEYGNISDLGKYDAVLLMNVLHHAGVDFDMDLVRSPDKVEDYIVRYLIRLKEITGFLVFQMGYNWGGDKSKPIVSPSCPDAMIEYMQRVCDKSGWEISATALYESKTKAYVDSASPERDVLHPDFLSNSEFYKRPLYFLTAV